MNTLSGHHLFLFSFVKLVDSVLNRVSEYLKRCHNVKAQPYPGSKASLSVEESAASIM